MIKLIATRNYMHMLSIAQKTSYSYRVVQCVLNISLKYLTTAFTCTQKFHTQNRYITCIYKISNKLRWYAFDMKSLPNTGILPKFWYKLLFRQMLLRRLEINKTSKKNLFCRKFCKLCKMLIEMCRLVKNYGNFRIKVLRTVTFRNTLGPLDEWVKKAQCILNEGQLISKI